ncbi:paired amphipathic helix sin3-like protein-related [Anaeramoeba flamelloides]|uniref:Paired amphipathic helix sin3-like protein-related n=1 Tax=Anaeramoeba flamelloides TaxID=1746091 RepID=A0ABQ8XHR5_9EUKA|nr:paired amphipathic helix sin3-like protein-related [Anaeramoeba flamelloides]
MTNDPRVTNLTKGLITGGENYDQLTHMTRSSGNFQNLQPIQMYQQTRTGGMGPFPTSFGTNFGGMGTNQNTSTSLPIDNANMVNRQLNQGQQQLQQQTVPTEQQPKLLPQQQQFTFQPNLASQMGQVVQTGKMDQRGQMGQMDEKDRNLLFQHQMYIEQQRQAYLQLQYYQQQQQQQQQYQFHLQQQKLQQQKLEQQKNQQQQTTTTTSMKQKEHEEQKEQNEKKQAMDPQEQYVSQLLKQRQQQQQQYLNSLQNPYQQFQQQKAQTQPQLSDRQRQRQLQPKTNTETRNVQESLKEQQQPQVGRDYIGMNRMNGMMDPYGRNFGTQTNMGTRMGMPMRMPIAMPMGIPMGVPMPMPVMGMPIPLGMNMHMPMHLRMNFGGGMPMNGGMGIPNTGLQNPNITSNKEEAMIEKQKQNHVMQQQQQQQFNNQQQLEQKQQQQIEERQQLLLQQQFEQKQQQLQQQQLEQQQFEHEQIHLESNQGHQQQQSPLTSNQIQTEMPTNSQQDQIGNMSVDDALLYLDEVRQKFSKNPQVYEKFLTIMKEFKDQTIDTPEVISRVTQLFKNHKDLILKFNQFLPQEYKVQESDIYQKVEELDTAISYVNKIKTRFQSNSVIYRSFLDILQHYQQELITIDEVFKQVKTLFAGEEDLINEFGAFLPSLNMVHESRSETTQSNNNNFQQEQQQQFNNQQQLEQQQQQQLLKQQQLIEQQQQQFLLQQQLERKQQFLQLQQQQQQLRQQQQLDQQNQQQQEQIIQQQKKKRQNNYNFKEYISNKNDNNKGQDDYNGDDNFELNDNNIRKRTKNEMNKNREAVISNNYTFNQGDYFAPRRSSRRSSGKNRLKSYIKQENQNEDEDIFEDETPQLNQKNQNLGTSQNYIQKHLVDIINKHTNTNKQQERSDENNFSKKKMKEEESQINKKKKIDLIAENQTVMDNEKAIQNVIYKKKDFFLELKEKLNEKDFFDFLKSINLYLNQKLQKSELIDLVTPILTCFQNVNNFENNNKNNSSIYLEKFKQLLFYGDFSFEQWQDGVLIPMGEIDKQSLEKCSPSYCKLPNQYKRSSNEMNELEKSVLNFEWFSTTNSILKNSKLFGENNNNQFESNFQQLSKKNKRRGKQNIRFSKEKLAFKLEETKINLDINIENNSRFISQLEQLKELFKQSNNNNSNVNVTRNKITSIGKDHLNIKCLKILYQENYLEILKGLELNPFNSLTVILKRLKKKNEELLQKKKKIEKFLMEAHLQSLQNIINQKRMKLKSIMRTKLKKKLLFAEFLMNEITFVYDDIPLLEDTFKIINIIIQNPSLCSNGMLDMHFKTQQMESIQKKMKDNSNKMETETNNEMVEPEKNNQKDGNIGIVKEQNGEENNNNNKNEEILKKKMNYFNNQPIIDKLKFFIDNFLLTFFKLPNEKKELIQTPTLFSKKFGNMNKDQNLNQSDANSGSENNDDYNNKDSDDKKPIKIEDIHVNGKSKKLQNREILFAGMEFYSFFYLHQQLYRILKQIKTALENQSNTTTTTQSNNNSNDLEKKIGFPQFLNAFCSLIQGKTKQTKFNQFWKQFFGSESYLYSKIGGFCMLILSQMKKIIFDGKTDNLVKLYKFERNNENFIENVYMSNCSVLMNSQNFFKFELNVLDNNEKKKKKKKNDNQGYDNGGGGFGGNDDENDRNNLLYTIDINLVENQIHKEKDLSNDLQKNKRINEKILSKFRAVDEINNNEFIIKQQIFLPRNSKKWKKRGVEATQSILILNELEQKFKLDTMESKYIQETEDIFYRFGWSKRSSKYQDSLKNENERK